MNHKIMLNLLFKISEIIIIIDSVYFYMPAVGIRMDLP